LDKVVIDLLLISDCDGGDIDLYLEVSHFHVLNSSLEMDGVRVVEVNVFVGEEGEGILHESADGSLGEWVVD
jgi:hypothetical protein